MAVPIFALFPVAPPRLAGVGLADTVSHHAAVALTGHSTIVYNPYAAVPSLHVGLAFAIGIAAEATFRARWARALALMWGPGSVEPAPAAPASPRSAAARFRARASDEVMSVRLE